jgi:K+-sensing histidine kinase KdpD
MTYELAHLGESSSASAASPYGAPLSARTSRPVARMLVLNPNRAGAGFFRRVVALCRALEARPIVLTVDRSEAGALRRERLARQAMAAAGGDADFDLVAGCDTRTAVARAARARACSRVICERSQARAWWHWPRRDPVRTLLPLADTLTLVVLPPEGDDKHPAESGCVKTVSNGCHGLYSTRGEVTG